MPERAMWRPPDYSEFQTNGEQVMDTTAAVKTQARMAAKPIGPLALTALGVVFGDIGTSPLYTFKTVIALAGGHPSPALTLGLVSLVIWTLIIITAVKYASFVMRVDNDGEG